MCHTERGCKASQQEMVKYNSRKTSKIDQSYPTLWYLELFTVSFYHFSFLRYLELAECHFSSDILVPFPDSGVLYSCVSGNKLRFVVDDCCSQNTC